MTNSFWFSTQQGETPRFPEVEPNYSVGESAKLDGQAEQLERTPSDEDGRVVGETGPTDSVEYNADDTQDIDVQDGMEPYQTLSAGYIQVGDTINQTGGSLVSSTITSGEAAETFGLKCNRERLTHLTRYNYGPDQSDFTISMWLKCTSYDVQYTNTFYSSRYNGSKFFQAYINNEGKINLGTANGTVTTADTVPLNRWVHVLLSTGPDGGRCWINGVKQWVSINTPNTDLMMYGEGALLRIGNYAIDPIVNNEGFRGYLSDVYVCQGTQWGAEVFTKRNALTGEIEPKSTAEVEAVTKGSRRSPYDQRGDASRKWSSLFTMTGQHNDNIENVFNGHKGNVDTNGFWGVFPSYGSDNKCKITANYDFGTISSLRIYVYNSGGSVGDFYVNGKDYRHLARAVASVPHHAWVEVPETRLDSIELGYRDGLNDVSAIAAIEVDGQELRDGPLNLDQNWSEGAAYTPGSVTSTNDDFGLAFNGVSYEGTWTYNRNASVLYTFEPPIDVTESAVITVRSGGLGTDNEIKVNGQAIDYTGITQATAVPVDVMAQVVAGKINTIELARGNEPSTAPHFYQLAIDGVVLADSGKQWNSTEVWSDRASMVISPSSGTISGTATNFFDGDYSDINSSKVNKGEGGTGTIIVTFDPPLPNGSYGFNFYIYGNTTPSGRVGVYSSSDTYTDLGTQISMPGNAEEIQELTYEATNGVKAITFDRIGTSDFVAGLTGISMNDVLLVDRNNYGEHGAHLTFNPDVDGLVYSNGLVGEDTGGYEASNMFNGSLEFPGCYFSPSGGKVVLPNIPVNESLVIYGSGFADGSWKVKLGGGQVAIPFTGPDGLSRPYSVPVTVPTTLDEISCINDSGNVAAIVVDGEILVEYSSIGADASGNNNWYDSGFIVGDKRQRWSFGVDQTNLKSWTSAQNAFDGYLPRRGSQLGVDAAYGIGANNGTAVAWSITIPDGVSTITAHVLMGLATPDNTLSISVNGAVTNFGGADNGFQNYDVSVSPGDSVVVSASYIDGSNYSYLLGISFDGKLLIDSDIADMVDDNPSKNYAVLDILRLNDGAGIYNGALEVQGGSTSAYSSATSSLSMPIGTGKYYCEFTTLQIPDWWSPWYGVCGTRFNLISSTAGWDVAGGTLQGVGLTEGYNIVGILFDTDTIQIDINVNSTLSTGFKQNSLKTERYSDEFRFFYASYGSGQTSPDVRFNFGQLPFASTNVTDNGDGTVTINGEVYKRLHK